jgi:hypothetical protein
MCTIVHANTESIDLLARRASPRRSPTPARQLPEGGDSPSGWRRPCFRRMSQTIANIETTTKLDPPCSNQIRFARVPAGNAVWLDRLQVLDQFTLLCGVSLTFKLLW